MGITDEVDSCSICGKTNLKSVVVLEHIETLETIHAGCICAGNLLHGTKSRRNGKAVKARANIVRLARKWLTNGFTGSEVVKGIGRRGYAADLKSGVIRIGDFATINVEQLEA